MVQNSIAHLHCFRHGKSRHLLIIRHRQLFQQLIQLCFIESRNTVQQSSQGIYSWSLTSITCIPIVVVVLTGTKNLNPSWVLLNNILYISFSVV